MVITSIMEKSLSSGYLWNKAATSGIILAAVTVIITLLGSLCAKIPAAFMASTLSVLLTIVKIAACAWTLRFFILKLKEEFPSADRGKLSGYGVKIAVCSSILVAGYNLLDITIIHPDTVQTVMDTFRETYSAMADSNTLAAMDSVAGKLPVYTFFSTFVYCFIWGWALSSAFAGSAAPSDPFDDIQKHSEE